MGKFLLKDKLNSNRKISDKLIFKINKKNMLNIQKMG